MTVVILGAGYWVWKHGTTRPAQWVVSETRDGQRVLVVDWVTPFGECGQRPTVEVEERATEVYVWATYQTTRGIECGQMTRSIHAPALVHLDSPLAGRKLVGPWQASAPVSGTPLPPNTVPTMPSVIGMDAAAARLALLWARYPETKLPSQSSGGSVSAQRPSPGSVLHYVNRGDGVQVSDPAPRLTFSS